MEAPISKMHTPNHIIDKVIFMVCTGTESTIPNKNEIAKYKQDKNRIRFFLFSISFICSLPLLLVLGVYEPRYFRNYLITHSFVWYTVLPNPLTHKPFRHPHKNPSYHNRLICKKRHNPKYIPSIPNLSTWQIPQPKTIKTPTKAKHNCCSAFTPTPTLPPHPCNLLLYLR